MGYVKKRKIKIKKKNFAIFIIFIMVFTFSVTQVIFLVVKLATTSKEVKPEVIEKNEVPEKDNKSAKLNNINQKIDYFNNDYLDRYLNYKNKNTNLTDEQIIKDVNMNLDQKKYKDIRKAKNLNTEKILVNKYYYVEKDYVPDNLETISSRYALSGMKLVDVAKDAFEDMAKDASKESLSIVAMSTYRSYDYQVDLYARYVREDGEAKADTYAGRPGHSEHQTGLAVDVYNKEENYTNFEKTKEYVWMQQHAHEYGFVLRFPQEKEEETGYEFESWHYRYVGVKAAKYIKEHNISFEEYYATVIKDW